MNNQLIYRAEIDGLRCLAVVSVLLYHVNAGLSGGFVGVDIFFVISGYLITNIILHKLASDSFSYTEFMAKRIRRIFTPMIVVVWGSLLVGYLVMLPTDLQNLAESAISQLLLISNYYFYVETGGYFGGKGEIFPLLHTWSLAVEEQFYILVPLFLIVLYKLLKKYLKSVFILFFIVSLALSIYGAYHYNTPTFYLLPTRAWEMGLGALIPILGIHTIIRSKLASELIAVFSVTMMLASILIFDLNTVFPGASALIPCGVHFYSYFRRKL